jgi:hypothetical protein
MRLRFAQSWQELNLNPAIGGLFNVISPNLNDICRNVMRWREPVAHPQNGLCIDTANYTDKRKTKQEILKK